MEVLAKVPIPDNILNAPRHADIALTNIEGKGRGVVATAFIPSGTMIEVSPVVPVAELSLEGTAVNDYAFMWEGEGEAIVFGITSLVNHSKTPNCRISRNHNNQTIELISLRNIEGGEELSYDYDCNLWFEIKE